MNTDPIADYLTRIRNAISAKHNHVMIPTSKIKESISKVLKEKGYIHDFKVIETNKGSKRIQKVIDINLKYTNSFANKISAITKIVRYSKPGLRKYSKSKEIPTIINGLGISIISTSKGIMSDKEASKNNVGGEIICYVY